MAAGPSRPRLTHFLCIPLATPAGRPQLIGSLAAFRRDVAATSVHIHGRPGPSRLPAAAVRPVGTLHLTLGVLSLGTPERLRQAVEALEGLRPPADAPVRVTLRSLAAMPPRERASVLYAVPEEADDGGGGKEGELRQLCERVRAVFAEAGLLEEAGRPLLLHATVLHMGKAERGRGGRGRGGRGRGGRGRGGRDGRGRDVFDAAELLDRYDGYVWARDVPVDAVALCRMGERPTQLGDDGEVLDAAYPVEAEAKMT